MLVGSAMVVLGVALASHTGGRSAKAVELAPGAPPEP
jgi:hypothetical protein